MTVWLENMDNILVFIWWIILFILIFPLLMLIFYTSMLWIKRIKGIPGYILVSSKKSNEKKRIKIFIVLVLLHSVIAYFLFLNPFIISIRREYLTKTFKNWEIIKSNLLEDKNFVVIGKKDDFITFFEVEEKGDTLIINKKTLLAVQPQYIIDRKYKTFKNIEVIYREEI
ncbi:hypothetical protein FSCG_01296 [Fusobacterium vincentii 4_1_13]|uniref:Uncharacterized protein n=2 Tax=Fusobacterium vincentii TaxID=155615 RepID=A0ABV3Y7C1_FUSVC|nr:hypothetical protein [Fusobacterium vincentii]EEO40583.1 hypothetical protein FSCG_01296 [Fusobacterium vincentii 4_1_13]